MRGILTAALMLALLAPSMALGQRLKRTTFTGDEKNPRIGFEEGLGQGGREYVFKAGMWAPVSIDFQVGDDPLPNAELSIESADSDDVQNTYTIKLPPLKPGDAFTANTYVRVGSRGGELVSRITQNGSQVAERRSNYDTMDLDDLLFLVIGSQTSGLREALNTQKPRDDINNPQMAWNRRGNLGHLARIDTVSSMPRHWFGYQSADM